MNAVLRLAILKHSVYQWVFARRYGLREDRLSGFITGRLNPTAAERATIAAALKLPEGRLFPASTAARNPAPTAGKKER